MVVSVSAHPAALVLHATGLLDDTVLFPSSHPSQCSPPSEEDKYGSGANRCIHVPLGSKQVRP